LAYDDIETDWDIFWDRPLSTPPSIPTWYTIEKGSCPPKFMRYVELDNDTRGITIACEDRGIMSIHAQSPDQTIEIYEEIEEKASGVVWVYFPLAKKETIVAGWIREVNTSPNNRRPALIISQSGPLCGSRIDV
jgi:hypothetical protein